MKMKVREFMRMQVEFKKLNKILSPEDKSIPISEKDVAVKRDKLIVGRFIAEQYSKLEAIQIKALGVPQRSFTGKPRIGVNSCIFFFTPGIKSENPISLE